MKNKKKQQGFTLVELLIVIVIIGILAAVIVPTVAGNIEKAKISSDVQDAKNMTTVLQSYCLSNGIDMTKLEAPEVRAIVSSGDKNYTFSPKGSKSTFWYNKSESKIEVAQGELISDTTSSKVNSVYADFTPDSIEELVDGYLYLNTTDKTGVANLLFQFRNLKNVTDYNSIANSVTNLPDSVQTKVDAVVKEFDINSTVFVGANGGTTRSATVKHVVFAEGIKVLSNNALGASVHYIADNANIRIPSTVEVVMPDAFTGVYSSTKIELAKPATKILEGALSETIKAVSSVSETKINEDRIKQGNQLITVTIGSGQDATTFGYNQLSEEDKKKLGTADDAQLTYRELTPSETNSIKVLQSIIDTTTKTGTVKINTADFLKAFPNVNSLTVIYTTKGSGYYSISVMAFDNSGMVLNLLITVREA